MASVREFSGPPTLVRNIQTRTGLLFLLAVFMGTIRLYAAITGSISGIVTDPSGALIPGITVVATSASTNIQPRGGHGFKGLL